MLRRQVSSLMLPLSEYARVDRNATLAHAIHALESSRGALAKGKHPHRAALLQDGKGATIGKPGHLAFLRALLPQNREWNSSAMLDRAGICADMKASSADMFEQLRDDVLDVCQRSNNICVSDVCTPATATISDAASLLKATRALITHQTLSLMVNEGNDTVGILRLSDLFDAITTHIEENDCGQE